MVYEKERYRDHARRTYNPLRIPRPRRPQPKLPQFVFRFGRESVEASFGTLSPH